MVDGKVTIQPQLTLTATIDHRFIDGAQLAVLAKVVAASRKSLAARSQDKADVRRGLRGTSTGCPFFAARAGPKASCVLRLPRRTCGGWSRRPDTSRIALSKSIATADAVRLAPNTAKIVFPDERTQSEMIRRLFGIGWSSVAGIKQDIRQTVGCDDAPQGFRLAAC